MNKIFYSGTFLGQNALNEMWRHVEKMSYQRIADVHFMQKRAELMSVGYGILE